MQDQINLLTNEYETQVQNDKAKIESQCEKLKRTERAYQNEKETSNYLKNLI